MSGESNDSPPDLTDGRGEGDTPGILLMTDAGDRFKLRDALRRGWRVTPERKSQYFAALDAVIRDEMAKDAKDRDSKAIAQCNAILQMEQAAMLRDLHQQEKYARIDEGKATSLVRAEKVGSINYDEVRARLVREMTTPTRN